MELHTSVALLTSSIRRGSRVKRKSRVNGLLARNNGVLCISLSHGSGVEALRHNPVVVDRCLLGFDGDARRAIQPASW